MGFLPHLYARSSRKLRLDDFIQERNGRRELFIPEEHWGPINQRYSRDEISDEIVDLFERERLPFPGLHHPSSLHDAAGDFCALLKMDASRLIISDKKLMTRHEYRRPLSKYCIQVSATGNDASDYFHRTERMKCDHVKFCSPYKIWQDLEKRKYILRALWSLKHRRVDTNLLVAAIALRWYIAAQFRPSAAKAIYELFGARHVLDPSAGWGDRFAGFFAASGTESYVGIDPNLNLHEGYRQQGKLYGFFCKLGKAYDFIPGGAEDADLSERRFDFVFTSPPYFGTERYSRHRGQSWLRYDNIDAWLHQFLFRMLRRAWSVLEPGGLLAINIADLGVTFRGSKKVCDPMNEYIASLPGAHYCGEIGLRLAARPHTGMDDEARRGTVFIEPIWVWGKYNRKKLEDYAKWYRNSNDGTFSGRFE